MKTANTVTYSLTATHKRRLARRLALEKAAVSTIGPAVPPNLKFLAALATLLAVLHGVAAVIRLLTLLWRGSP